MTEMRVAVFASGGGTDFQALADASESAQLGWKVCLLITNNPEAGAVERARKMGIPFAVLNSRDFAKREEFVKVMLDKLDEYSVNFIALAGYLKKIPTEVIRKYKGRIVNIHPALLPMFGGKGFYGKFVHQAVLDAGCKVSGVTVHFVDEEYDKGLIIAQRCVPVENDDDADALGARVLKTEHKLYPEVMTKFAQGYVKIENGRVKVN